MTKLLTRAQPPLEFIVPSLNPWVLKGCQTLLPFWLNWQTNITQIQADNLEILANLYQYFQQEKIRFLMAFRHPNVNDPYCMGYLLWKLLPNFTQTKNIPLKYPIHAHFMYDRGIPLWAGSTIGWLYSRLGGTSIQRGKLDLVGLRSARDIFLNSKFPLAAAPEGATNGHNEIVSPLEPGLAQLGFWCVEDLRKANRNETVFIVPIGIQYHYVTPPWNEIQQLLTELEIDSGISTIKTQEIEQKNIYDRLYHLGEHLLTIMENFYRQFYHQTIPDTSKQELSERLPNLLNIALQVAENYFNLQPKGTVIDRCRRLEQAGWDYIYREDFKQIDQLSAVEKGLGDRLAEEASLRMWHMRIVESFVSVTGYYVKDKPTVERFAETTLLLWDLVTRIEGGNAFFRPQFGQQTVQITIGNPLSISERFDDYKTSRRQAVANLTQDLQISLESLIIRDS
ncbi:1-acyl-sn-glycerol-3-phosphate acyltransferase [Aphanothece sacrum]|uniref:Phospholipid/glycerol acyltransferase n=1 Tax=Aphanothece sacrum FPU1 TaxID=1920663 RepID=A0A401IFT8_APHSA|nr:1-acyl-sn-glycerol-3-phosphate acyltransferase [Aphanothece sacrum]GBF80086.1 phospholipid/glycerol acyltransferase [Aphanothece sacrum FPU1]GBF84629.1 phospholipid/glycerol acyltransferase [Aphanothece sacrum FPU3]